MMHSLRRLLDGVTMYRVVLYGLAALALIAVALRLVGAYSYASPGTLLLMLVVLVALCTGVNIIFGKLYRIPINQESALITGLILFFVLGAPARPAAWIGICFAALVAIASKFVLTSRGAAIFNPAALGVFVVGLLGIGSGTWWVANTALFIPVVCLGVVVLLKLRRIQLFLAFAIPAAAMIVARTVGPDLALPAATMTAFTLYPLVFLGTIMLTEPGTMPSTYYKQIIFGGIVGLIFGAQLDTAYVSTSPELALLAGNLFALAASPRTSTKLKLVAKKQMSPTTYDLAFEPERRIYFTAGQYMEFTLPGVPYDRRGNRRTFSIASSPEDRLVHIGIKFYEPGSKFKQRLASLKPGDVILANHIAGDFTLPRDESEPVVCLAGGIGITPFIAMLQDMVIANKVRPLTIYYFASDPAEIVYKDVLKKARDLGVHVILRVGDTGRLTETEIQALPAAQYYLSGPPGLVMAYKEQLKKQGIQTIHTDYFTGY